jgi:hypothetical protein
MPAVKGAPVGGGEEAMRRLKTVFHVHTNYSDDGDASVEDLIADARRSGVDCIVVTDHDTIEGAERLADAAPDNLRIVVGEEVSTRQGHLIGLFLRRAVPPGLPVRRTAELIHEQDALVVAPHPFNRLFGCSLREAVYDLADVIDLVEVCNGQNLLPFANRRAEAFALQHALPHIVGADMHHRGYLGRCFQWVPPFEGPAGFLAAMREAELVKNRHTLAYFARSAHVQLAGRIGWGLPARYGRNCTTRRRRMPDLPQEVSPSSA